MSLAKIYFIQSTFGGPIKIGVTSPEKDHVLFIALLPGLNRVVTACSGIAGAFHGTDIPQP